MIIGGRETRLRSVVRGCLLLLQSGLSVFTFSTASGQDIPSPTAGIQAVAVCKGAGFDDTLLLQAALDRGLPTRIAAPGGSCVITRPLILHKAGQRISGQDMNATKLTVGADFAGRGVFLAQTGEPGPTLEDLSVWFEHSAAAPLERRPPAFVFRDTPRFTLKNVGCFAATTCIDMTGNSGGALIDGLQMSAFETGIAIDGSLDTVRLVNIHAWPFHIDYRNLKSALSTTTWIKAGRVDDLKVIGGLFLQGTAFEFYKGKTGSATGSITNTDFDSNHRGVVMSSGNISINGGYFASAGANDQQIVITGGTLGVFGATIGCSSGGVATAKGVIEISGPEARLSVVGSPSFVCGDDDRPIVDMNAGTMIFNDNAIDQIAGTAKRYPKIWIRGISRVTLVGNRISDKGSGRGVFISIEQDNINRVIGNASPGWTSDLQGSQMRNSLSSAKGGVYFAND